MAVGRRIAAGDVVAGYEVERLVGSGGMGEVYRARDTRLGRPVALKLLAERLTDDDSFRERMLRESRIAASLDHPNVVPIYEAGEDGRRLYIAMRFVDGTDLKGLLRSGPLEPARAVAVAAQVAAALDAAHAQGLVHRDVKPSNVLLDQAGGREHVYLADFGLTQSASDSGPADGQLLGTVDYVAPEQIRGDDLDGAADTYALGCLLFECLTGTLPFAGASDVAVIYAHLEQDPPAASERAPELPPAVDSVLRRAMAKEPGQRQATCVELVDEARAALGLVAAAPPRRGLLAAAVAAVAAAALAGAAGVWALAGGGAASPASGGRILRIDPATNAVAAEYAVSAHPASVTTSRDRVWVGDFRDGSLWRLDPATGALARFTTTGEPRDLAALADAVYVASDGETYLDGSVTRYDAVTGVRQAGVKALACSVAAGDGLVWIAGCPYLVRLSTDSGPFRVLRQVAVPFQQPRSTETDRVTMRDMAIGAGALWVLGDPVDRRVFKVDPRDGRILGITPLRFAPRSIAVADGAVWVSGPLEDVVGRLDARTGRVTATVRVPRGASGIAAGSGAVWVASALDGSVSRIDPRTATLVETIDVDGSPREVAVGAGGVWVTADGA